MTTANVRLNQQQLELLDDATARLEGASRAEAIRHALREHGPELLADSAGADSGEVGR